MKHIKNQANKMKVEQFVWNLIVIKDYENRELFGILKVFLGCFSEKTLFMSQKAIQDIVEP